MKKVNKIFLVISILFSQFTFAEDIFPHTVSEFKETSVRITNMESTSGGTGSIFRSFNDASHILTNKHVCELIKSGGLVNYKGKNWLISHYKEFPDHDLCIVRVSTNFNVNIEISDTLAQPSSQTVVSGHPNLLPHIASIGHLSENEVVTLVVGKRPCMKADFKTDPMVCIFFGGVPIVKEFDAQVVSNLVKPGSSGSAVFNSSGRLVGVVFAGSGRDFSYGFIVPQLYVLYFIQNAQHFKWQEAKAETDTMEASNTAFNYDKCREIQFDSNPKLKTVKDFCKSVSDTMIWRK
jgi:S1-C subfamily serine protease